MIQIKSIVFFPLPESELLHLAHLPLVFGVGAGAEGPPVGPGSGAAILPFVFLALQP